MLPTIHVTKLGNLILAYECNLLSLLDCIGRLFRPVIMIMKGINFKDKWGYSERLVALASAAPL